MINNCIACKIDEDPNQFRKKSFCAEIVYDMFVERLINTLTDDETDFLFQFGFLVPSFNLRYLQKEMAQAIKS